MANAQLVAEFRRLILGVERTHRGHLDRMELQGGASKELYDRARDRFEHLGYQRRIRDNIERLLPSSTAPRTDFITDKTVLFLKPTQKGDLLLPVVSLKCNFDREPIPELRIRVGLCKLHNHKIRVLGFRFETPENDGAGRHDFYHSQIIRALEKGAPGLNEDDADANWLPDGQPSLPLDAECPITLTLAFLISVYGLWILDELKEFVPNHFEKLICWRRRPSFWRVQLGENGWQYLCDAESRIEKDIRAILATKFNLPSDSVRLTRITAESYAAAGPNHRIPSI